MARGHFFEYTRRSEREFSYRYTCESCGCHTDWFDGSIKQKANRVARMSRLKIQQQVLSAPEILYKMQKTADKRVDEVRTAITEALDAETDRVYIENPFIAQIYNEQFSAGAACPKCKSEQSWYPEAASKKKKSGKPKSAAGSVINRPEIKWGDLKREADEAYPDSDVPIDAAPAEQETLIAAAGATAVYRQLAGKEHINLPQIMNVSDRDDGAAEISYAGITGVTLKESLASGARAPELEDYLLQLCDAMEFLSQQEPPLYYHDVSAEDIIISDDNTLKLINLEKADGEGSLSESLSQIGKLLHSLGDDNTKKFKKVISECESGEELTADELRAVIYGASKSKLMRTIPTIALIAFCAYLFYRVFSRVIGPLLR